MADITFTTQRLLLRDFHAEDWREIHRYGSDAEAVRHMDWGPNSEDETRAFVQHVLTTQTEVSRKTFELAVCLKESGELIGGVGIRIKSDVNREGDIGYILRRDCWGKGFGTEAARAMLRYGFESLGLHRIYATAAPPNSASRRVLEKMGMRQEGVLRQHVLQRGVWRDSILYAILEGEGYQPKEKRNASSEVFT